MTNHSTLPSNNKRRAVSAAIFCDGSLLILRRGEHEGFLPNYWELPGGHEEKSDGSLEYTLKREILEETGINFSMTPEVLKESEFEYLDGSKTTEILYLVTTPEVNIQINPSEHTQYTFINTINECSQLNPMTEHARKGIYAALAKMKKV